MYNRYGRCIRKLFCFNTRRFSDSVVAFILILTTIITIFLLSTWNEERHPRHQLHPWWGVENKGGVIQNQKNTFILSLDQQQQEQQQQQPWKNKERRDSSTLNMKSDNEVQESYGMEMTTNSPGQAKNRLVTVKTQKPASPITCPNINTSNDVVLSSSGGSVHQSNITSMLNLPSIFNYLPHLARKGQNLDPRRMENITLNSDASLTKKRKFAIGVPTVHRDKKGYLIETLNSLLKSISKSDLAHIVIVVYIGENNQSRIDRVMLSIRHNFLREVEQGIIDVIAPPEFYYPDLAHLPSTFGDPIDRVKWRSKQNLDYSYLMMYAHNRGEYYLQLEDDIIATNGFVKKIEGFVKVQGIKPWFMLEFCRLGFIGKLFHAADLSRLVEFFLMFYKVKPNDWLLDHYMQVLVCSPEKGSKHCNTEKKKIRITSRPSLFQHVGRHSSLKGKIQKLVDRGFPGAKKTSKIKGENEFFPHKTNIKAKVRTNAVEFSKFKMQSAYDGLNLAWIKTPQNNTYISFHFHTPVTVKRFLFRTGNKDHPGDILKYGVVEALSARTMKRQVEASKEVHQIDDSASIPRKDFTLLGTFNDKGLARGNVSSSMDELVELRVRVTLASQKNWVIFNEFLIE